MVKNHLCRIPRDCEPSRGSKGVKGDGLDASPKSGHKRVDVGVVSFGFLQHEDSRVLLLNLFPDHSVVVGTIDASNIPRYYLH